ncbi:hypothetical protein ASG11_09885 [Sphingomonas sp. Leaf357]|uniref:hypothetical protein n=1 Tax=Sphingomonas sp. Leaf357 TaxID=1736350 RepID=UPI0006F4B626|nr:hypothetical protein [Sphingomonas sp. Leaf357]KQS04520.1 hypothetical protein ASG11_09885 [Sphingomonas sp. Leaf357]
MASVLQLDQLAPMLRVIPSLSRPMLSRLTERLIERLDEIDGDDDLEPNGDERDGENAEDDFWSHWLDHHAQPGCPLADPGEDDDPDDYR